MTQTLRAADRSMLVKVPQITVGFWVAKLLTTAFGESASDFLVHAMPPVAAVLLGFVAFVIALGLQLRAPAYRPVTYWFAVAMVGVFGTMAADVLHVGLRSEPEPTASRLEWLRTRGVSAAISAGKRDGALRCGAGRPPGWCGCPRSSARTPRSPA